MQIIKKNHFIDHRSDIGKRHSRWRMFSFIIFSLALSTIGFCADGFGSAGPSTPSLSPTIKADYLYYLVNDGHREYYYQLEINFKPSWGGHDYDPGKIKYTVDIWMDGIRSGSLVTDPYMKFDFASYIDRFPAEPNIPEVEGEDADFSITTANDAELLYFRFSDVEDRLASDDEVVILTDAEFKVSYKGKDLIVNRDASEIDFKVP